VSRYSLSHLSDPVLLRDLVALVTQDRATTAALLAHLAEVDARRLYLPAAYPSMFAYCVGELGLSEEAAFKRIRAARTARQFPALFPALADGRLHLSAVVLLTPYLTPANADELLAAAAHRSKSEIEAWLAQRFPRSELLPLVQALPAAPRADEQLAPGQVVSRGFGEGQLSPGTVAASTPRAKVAPLAPERFALQLTIGQGTQDKLRYAQALLGHQVPSGEVAEVLDRALDALIRQLERRKFAATPRPRPRPRPRPQRSSANPRQVPAEVKRTVWQRDGGQCTFVSAAGRRCPARTRLEFDHVEEVARGGRATVAGIRLRCRAHNQYGAECTFGAGFMDRKRRQAREVAAQRAGAVERARVAAEERAKAAAEVIPWLRRLGLRADEAKWAAEACESLATAPFEERVRAALSYFGRPPQRRAAGSRQPVT
jgi:hypothetical protein